MRDFAIVYQDGPLIGKRVEPFTDIYPSPWHLVAAGDGVFWGYRLFNSRFFRFQGSFQRLRKETEKRKKPREKKIAKDSPKKSA